MLSQKKTLYRFFLTLGLFIYIAIFTHTHVLYLIVKFQAEHIKLIPLIMQAVIVAVGPICGIFLTKQFTNRKLVIGILIGATTFIQFLNLALESFFIQWNHSFDFNLILYHLNIAGATLNSLYPGQSIKFIVLGFILAYGIIQYFFFTIVGLRSTRKISKIIPLIILIIFLWLAKNSEVVECIRQLVTDNGEIIRVYNEYLDRDIKNKSQINDDSYATNTGRNIIMIQLESLNSDLVNETVTPNLLKIANQGFIAKTIQNNSVTSIRSFEGLLCGLIPSISSDLTKMDIDFDKLTCLPKILSKQGYKTRFFLGEDTLNDTENLMTKLGFDEINIKNLMQPEDQKVQWGYRDDIFYKRIVDHLEKYKEKKQFVLIEVATNHFPFYKTAKAQMSEFETLVPHQNPKTFKENLENTTFIQDYFLGKFYDEYYIPLYFKDTDLIIVSDHSWPYGKHANNTMNIYESYQENFTSPFVYIPALSAPKELVRGVKHSEMISQRDIPETILDLVKSKVTSSKQTFSQLIFGQNTETSSDKCHISTQPYSGGYVSIIEYPFKYVFLLKENYVYEYNLKEDPDEKQPNKLSRDTGLIQKLRNCLESTL